MTQWAFRPELIQERLGLGESVLIQFALEQSPPALRYFVFSKHGHSLLPKDGIDWRDRFYFSLNGLEIELCSPITPCLSVGRTKARRIVRGVLLGPPRGCASLPHDWAGSAMQGCQVSAPCDRSAQARLGFLCLTG